MAKQTINIGSAANDGSGDPLRNAFDKSNDNFNELYFALGGNAPVSLFDSSLNIDYPGKANKISFLYSEESELLAVSPSTYHGAIGHAHDTGSLYYAHGSWRKLLSDNSAGDILNYTDPLVPFVYDANVTNEEAANYVLKTNADGTYTWVEQASGGGGGSSFANTDIDAHLNVSSASANEFLQWDGSDYTWAAASGSGGASANSFGTIAIAGVSIEADSDGATLNINPGSGITLQGDPNTDTITISSSAGGGGDGTDLNSVNSGDVNVATDLIGFIDNDDSGATKKDSIVDFVAAIAGTGLSAASGQLTVSSGSSFANTDIDAHLNTSSAQTNEILSWNGSDYAWVADQTGSGGASLTRVTETENTGSIANATSANVQYSTLGKSYAIYSVTAEKECRIRIYSDTASRTADASRAASEDPPEGAGVVAEFIATSPNTTFKVTPAIYGYIDDSETVMPVSVTNNTGSTTDIDVSITVLKLEDN